MSGRALKGSLVKRSILRGHSKRHIGIERRHRVPRLIEMPVNCLGRRKGGVEMMSRCLIAIEFALVTCRARVVADEAALLVRAGRGQRRSRSLIRTALPIGRLLPARPNRKYQRSADDQKRRPESPPWKLRSHLPLRFLARLPC